LISEVLLLREGKVRKEKKAREENGKAEKRKRKGK